MNKKTIIEVGETILDKKTSGNLFGRGCNKTCQIKITFISWREIDHTQLGSGQGKNIPNF